MKRKTEINISKIPSTSTPPAKVSKYDAGGMGIIPEDIDTLEHLPGTSALAELDV